MQNNKIGVAITTYNRPNIFRKNYEKTRELLPNGAHLVFVEDNGSVRQSGKYCHVFNKRVGIPAAKNKCIELLMSLDCDHLFLFDDDTYPLVTGWHLPYINSPFDHMCYTFLQPQFRDFRHKYHELGNGCMMYMTKRCIEKIGGFDTDFDLGKFEHVEYSRRACNADLIPRPFIDVIGSEKLLYCMDQNPDFQRSMTDNERVFLTAKNANKFYDKMNDKQFKPYSGA